MSELIFEVGLDEMSTGLRLGVHRTKRGLWNSARGMQFDKYGVHAARGRKQMLSTNLLFDSAPGEFDATAGLFDNAVGTSFPLTSPLTTPITGIYAHLHQNRTRQVVFGDLNSLYRYAGAEAQLIDSGFHGMADASAGYRATQWSMTSYGNWVLATNGVDAPVILKNGEGTTPLANVPFEYAEVLFKFGPHVVAVNTSNGHNWVEWCAEDSPEQWDPQAYPTAGNLPLWDLENPIIAAKSLGEFWGLYTENELQLMRRVSSTYIFGVFPALQGVGAVSKNSVVVVGGINYGITRQGIFRTDGVSVQWLSYPKMERWFETAVNWDQRSKIVGWDSRSTHEVCWAVPTQSAQNNNAVLRFNYETGEFGLTTDNVTAAAEQGVWQFPVLGYSNGIVAFGDDTYGDMGAGMQREVVTVPMDFGVRTAWKHLDVLQLESEGEFQVEVGWAETISGEMTWADPVQVNDEISELPICLDGVFFQMRFSAVGTEYWSLSGIKAFGSVTGGTI